MKLYIDIRKHPDRTPVEGVYKLFTLDNSTLYAQRAENVTLFVDAITKTVSNYLTAFSIIGVDFTLVHNRMYFEGEKAFEHIAYFTCLKSVNRELNEQRARCRALINEHHIPMEVVAHIDDYLNYELLNRYDISISTTVLLREKKNTYVPTDLERKEWAMSKGQAFTHPDRLTYYETVTLADKLLALVTLNYYIDNGLNSTDYWESSPAEVGRKAQLEAMKACGHEAFVPPEDEQAQFRTAQLYYRMFD